MNEPLITPQLAFYCFIGVVVIDVLYLIVRKALADTNSIPDPKSEDMGEDSV